jgi:AcrR family transcriptional regulator
MGQYMMITNRQIQKKNTRQKLLNVALTEFEHRGIMATRMSDIASAAGVSHGTVFAHFETQEALITAVIEDTGIKIARRTHELAQDSGGLRQVLASHLEGIREFEAFYTRLVIEARGLPLIARETLISIQSAISLHISQAAQREMNLGSILPMPISLLFNTWVGLVHYYLTNGDLFAPGDSVIDRYGSILLDHFMNLVSHGQS